MDFGHVDYPHEPGTLYDCMGCELGECTCDPEDEDGFGCVSQDCLRDLAIPFELVVEEDETDLYDFRLDRLEDLDV